MTCAKLVEVEIDIDDIWKDDVLERQEVAEKYTNLLKTIQHPFVISVNSSYGMGKTFFLKRWQKMLETEFATLFYNAWQTDFHEHAFIPFVYHMIQEMKKNQFITTETELFTNFQAVAEQICISMSKNVVAKITNDIVKQEDLDKALAKIDSHLDKGEVFNSYVERLNLLNQFKECLTKIVEQLEQTEQKLVIFIDELERCRPTFAVELLENIKHLFDVDGIIFIVGTDREQLQHTISNIYGAGMNSQGYLRKFIDLELTLPEPSSSQFVQHVYNSFNLGEIVLFEQSSYFGSGELVDFMSIFSNAFDLSLREITQYFTEINIIVRTLGKGQPFFPALLGLLICLKHKQPVLYGSLGIEPLGLSFRKIQELLKDVNIEEEYKEVFESWLYVALDDAAQNYISNEMNIYAQALNSGNNGIQNSWDFRIIHRANKYRQQLAIKHKLTNSKALILVMKRWLSFC